MANNLLDYVGLGYFLEKIKTLFVTALGTSGNNLTWTKNGTTNNITIPYAMKAGGLSITSTDNAVARFDGASGNVLNSGVTINDSNHVTASKFITSGGTASQVVCGNGSLATSKKLPQYEAYLEWGGKNFSGSYGPIDAAMVSELGAARTMFSKAAGILIEYSTDSGTTWSNYEASDAAKIALFSIGLNFYTGASSTAGGGSPNNMLRVTLRTSAAGIYTTLNKFVIFVGTNRSTGCYCTIRCRTLQNYEDDIDTWVTLADLVPILGWTGYNVINIIPTTTYGNTKNTQYGEWLFIFGYTGFSGSSIGLYINKIFGFGGMGWVTPSNMAKTGHLYSYDAVQNATFPAQITATALKKSGGTSSQFLKADGSVDSTSYGTYSKPSGGIPKTDLASAVQTSLGKADTALQSFTETDPTVPSWAKQSSKPTYTAQEVGALPDTTNYAGSQSVGGVANKAASIPFGYTESTSTSSALVATVPGITELEDGVCCMIDNTVVAGSSNGFTLNVNGLGAKTVYSINSTMHSSPTIVTTWNKPYRGFLVYLAAMNNNTGGWILGYLTNTTYSAITAAAIETGTATTARTVTAAVLKAAYNIDTTTGTIKIGANSITPLTQHLDISGKEDKTNKVTSLSSSSTDTQYPSAKLLYDLLALKLDDDVVVVCQAIDYGNGPVYEVNKTFSLITLDIRSGKRVWFYYGDSATPEQYLVLYRLFSLTYADYSKIEFSNNSATFKINSSNVVTLTEANYESTVNKVTSISSSSTDTLYPSAKAVYSNINNKHSKEYLTFEVLESGTINFTPISGNENIILYSKDNGVTWTLGSSVSVNTGDRVMWKGSGFTPENSGTGGIGTFGDNSSTSPVTTIKFKVYGNIMSLVYGDNFENLTEFAGAANFCCLFKETKVTEAHNLILPSTDLVERCYNKMFMNCAELISMPDLHGIVLAKHCYSKMFSGCTKLYYNIPEVLPITTLAINCYDGMFINCSSMIVAPKLPATTLTEGCYSAMFLGCSNLEVAPELPAAVFANTCCWRMFDGCAKIKFIKCLATNISASNSHPAWTTGVGANGIFIKADNPPAWPSGVNGIPTGWTSYTESLWKEARQHELSTKENTTNKVTSLSASSTDTQYPSAKCVYDALQSMESDYIFIEGSDSYNNF